MMKWNNIFRLPQLHLVDYNTYARLWRHIRNCFLRTRGHRGGLGGWRWHRWRGRGRGATVTCVQDDDDTYKTCSQECPDGKAVHTPEPFFFTCGTSGLWDVPAGEPVQFGLCGSKSHILFESMGEGCATLLLEVAETNSIIDREG